MSFLGSSLKFENFRLGHMWNEIKHHPQRLLFGGMMDPLSTKLENTITGSHFTPQSDQLGGAYGGRTISAFGGGQQGGIYKQAQDAGIDTSQGAKFENAAHIAAALGAAVYGGAALYGAGGGAGGAGGAAGGAGGGAGAGAGAGSGLTEFGAGDLSALGGTETYTPAMMEATRGASTGGWQQYARLASNLQGQGRGQGQSAGSNQMRDWTQPNVNYIPKTPEQELAEAIAKQQQGLTYG